MAYATLGLVAYGLGLHYYGLRYATAQKVVYTALLLVAAAGRSLRPMAYSLFSGGLLQVQQHYSSYDPLWSWLGPHLGAIERAVMCQNEVKWPERNVHFLTEMFIFLVNPAISHLYFFWHSLINYLVTAQIIDSQLGSRAQKYIDYTARFTRSNTPLNQIFLSPNNKKPGCVYCSFKR